MPAPSETLDLDSYFAMPRLANLHLSPDGSRLVLTVQTVSGDGKRFAGSLWEVATSGEAPQRRLTRSHRGETARGFLRDGSVLFTSSRPDPEQPPSPGQPPDDAERDALFVLPVGGGEPRRTLAPPGGVGPVLTGRASPQVVVAVPLHPGAATFEEDEAREKARSDAGVAARLMEHYPDRYWDHDIGPRAPHLFAVAWEQADTDPPAAMDLTPSPPWAGWLEDMPSALSEDGARVAVGTSPHHATRFKVDLAVIDTAGGPVRTLVDRDEFHGAIAWSPDGTTLAAASLDLGSPTSPARSHLRLVDAATGAVKDLLPDWEGSAHEIAWTRDGSALIITADEHGHVPVFRVELAGTGSLTRLTASGAYRDLAVSPDGTALYAIRSHINEPPVPVALEVRGADQEPRVLAAPTASRGTGTRIEEVTTVAADGTEVHAWLVLPEREDTAPLPLAVLIHGGPFASWAGWSWRWSAALVAAQGWAVLMPNPRLSTGYGHHHVASSWGDWAALPSSDILACVDATCQRPDVDGDRTAALGGSYGGYMANWLAVTTDRFRAIVTHASVWDLIDERNASDLGFLLDREFGDPLDDAERWRQQSPHLRAASLQTPMLVIHGAHDQRVTLGNSHSLFAELQLRGIPSRMLVYPDENHWVLKPQNSRLWYETVFGFLDEHVRGEPWRRPHLL